MSCVLKEANMNRYTKVLITNDIKAREGLTPDEIVAIDFEDEVRRMIHDLAGKIHSEKFSEEYDFMMDERADIKGRKRGINPMSQNYIDKIDKKRDDLGVARLPSNGLAVTDETYLLCEAEAKAQVLLDIDLTCLPNNSMLL